MVDIAGTNLGKSNFYTNNSLALKPQALKEATNQQFKSNIANNNCFADTNKSDNIVSTYSAVVNYIKKEEEKNSFNKLSSSPTSNKQSKDSVLSLICNESRVSDEPKKEVGKRKAPTLDKTFNILGMFKPGEILNSLTKEETFTVGQKPSLSFLS
jgi:hypothetical protein